MKRLYFHIRDVSEFKSRKDWKEYLWNEILSELGKANKNIYALINPLLSATEREKIIHRAVAAIRLQQGASYSEIGRELWLSSQTIRAIKKSFDLANYQSDRSRIPKTRKKDLRGYPTIKRNPFVRYRQTKYGKVRMF